MCQAPCWALEYKEACRVWCPAVVSAFLGRTPSLPRGSVPPSTGPWSDWKSRALLLPVPPPHMHVTRAGPSEFPQRFHVSIAEGKGLDSFGVLTSKAQAWLLAFVFSHTCSQPAAESQALRETGETARGTVLRTSLEPPDLARPEASGLHTSSSRSRQWLLVVWRKLICA